MGQSLVRKVNVAVRGGDDHPILSGFTSEQAEILITYLTHHHPSTLLFDSSFLWPLFFPFLELSSQTTPYCDQLITNSRPVTGDLSEMEEVRIYSSEMWSRSLFCFHRRTNLVISLSTDTIAVLSAVVVRWWAMTIERSRSSFVHSKYHISLSPQLSSEYYRL